jgi:hypothetical protein
MIRTPSTANEKGIHEENDGISISNENNEVPRFEAHKKPHSL